MTSKSQKPSFATSLSIGKHRIGPGHPTFIIAEAGVNHNGDPQLARNLVDAAAESGAQAVKFQTFKAEKLVTRSASRADYQVENLGEDGSQFDMLKRLELKYEFHRELMDYAESKGLVFLSTPFDLEAIEFLSDLGVAAFKAGSGDLTNLPYLDKMARQGRPVIISTGMANLEESREAVESIAATGNMDLVVLHCTTNYPCPLSEVNLAAMQTLQRELGVLVGYSDHTVGTLVPKIAVAAGAQVIEKHFTLDKNMEGPDHRASLEPAELAKMVREIKEMEEVMGSGEKVPNASEEKIMQVVRKSVVAAVDIPQGTVLSAEMLTIKRPGTGLHPRTFSQIIGQKTTRDIQIDTVLNAGDLE